MGSLLSILKSNFFYNPSEEAIPVKEKAHGFTMGFFLNEIEMINMGKYTCKLYRYFHLSRLILHNKNLLRISDMM